MKRDDHKSSPDVRLGVLMIAAVATFLSLTGCDHRPFGPYQPGKTDERQEQNDQEPADRIRHSGYSGGSGGHIFGTPTGSGTHADPHGGTVRGGFGQTGAMHASAT